MYERERKVFVRGRNNFMTFFGLCNWNNEDKYIFIIGLIKYSKGFFNL